MDTDAPAAGPVIAYTYALQYLAKGAGEDEKVWKTARTVADELVTGALPITAEQPSIDLVTVGPYLLSQTLSQMGADGSTFYRMQFWKGDVPNDELDATASCMTVYDT
ncbi:hypothetical protein [Kitasatospora sp. NPDC101183]|uniref:hypothetical protein n=1 Tax=Kitasatospora sp. NPDC101183 TaxID=3364100 RepID=UPI00380F2F16